MITIRSFVNTFTRYAVINDDNTFEIIYKDLSMEEVSKMVGVFDFLNNSILGALKIKDIDYIYQNKNLIKLPKGYELNYHRIDSQNCELNYSFKGENILHVKYKLPEYGLIDRIGYTESEEDYNFGMWLYKKYLKDIAETT